MKKEQIPPGNAFWSAPLYDTKYGYFIPNDCKQSIVVENGGMKPDDSGGIAISIAAEKPEGVPEDYCLPINNKDEGIALMFRLYQPDLEQMKTWQAPKIEKLS